MKNIELALAISLIAFANQSHSQTKILPDSIRDGSIENTKLVDMPAWSIKARNNAATGSPQDLSVGDIAEEVTPAGGDYLIGFDASNQLRKFNIGSLPSAGGGASISGTPADNEIAVWTGATAIEGDSLLTWNGALGIGTNDPKSAIHVLSNGTPFNAVLADLLIQDSSLSSDIGMISIISGDTANSQLTFGNTSNQFLGQILYNANTSSINFNVGGVQRLSIAGSGDVDITSGNVNLAALSTIDGRDVSVDGAKLDGVEALATVDSKQIKVSSNDTTEGYLEDKVNSIGPDGVGIVRAIVNEGVNEAISFRLGDHYLSLASTGIYTGGVLSAGATTGTFDISAGEGFYIDSNTDFHLVKDNVQTVTIAARTNEAITNILAQPVTYISINENDTIVQSATFPTPQQRRESIFLGVIVHSDNVNVNAVNNLQVSANDIAAQSVDVMEALGFFNLEGNRITANGANLSIDKSIGKAFKRGANYASNKFDPHTLDLALQTPVTFRYRNQDSSEGADTTLIDPTTYDNSGVTATVPANNNATIQRVYMFPSGGLRIQRGQEVFSNFNEAIAAVGKEGFLVEPNIEANGLLLASIVTTKNASDLTDDATAQIFIASRFGELGSVGSSATTTLQNAYNNSVEPEILTDATRGALSIRVGSGADTDTVLEAENAATSTVFSVDGEGDIVANSIALDGGAIDYGVQTTAPAGAALGSKYTDTSIAYCWYDGTSWVKLSGAGTCL